MFEKRKRRKAAEQRFDEAVDAEYERRGVVPRDSTSAAMREAMREAGFGSPGDPAYTRLVLEVMGAASERLSPEDRELIG